MGPTPRLWPTCGIQRPSKLYASPSPRYTDEAGEIVKSRALCSLASVWYCRLQSDRPRLFIFRFFELHTTPQSSLYFILFLLISVKWCLFIKAIELLQCLNDPDLTHIHLANCTDSDKCTDNQRERHPSSGWSPSTWRAGPGPAETEPFRNVTVGHVYMHPCVCSQRKTLLCEEAFDESCQNAHPTSTS